MGLFKLKRAPTPTHTHTDTQTAARYFIKQLVLFSCFVAHAPNGFLAELFGWLEFIVFYLDDTPICGDDDDELIKSDDPNRIGACQITSFTTNRPTQAVNVWVSMRIR